MLSFPSRVQKHGSKAVDDRQKVTIPTFSRQPTEEKVVDKITDIESLNFEDSISVIVSTNFDVCDGEDGEDSSTIPSVNR